MDIKIGHVYKFNLIGGYTLPEPLFLNITAISKKDVLDTGIYGNYDIRKELMPKAGIATFITLTQDVDIIVATDVKSVDPIEYDTKPKFIPTSIIDYSSVEEYIEADRFVFNVEGVTRYFEYELDKLNFRKAIDVELASITKESENLAGDTLTVSNVREAILSSKSLMEDQRKYREQLIADNKKRNADVELAKMVERNEILDEHVRLREWDEQLLAKQVLLMEEQNNLNDRIASANQYISKADTYILKLQDVYNLVKDQADAISVTIPTWQQIWDNVFNGN